MNKCIYCNKEIQKNFLNLFMRNSHCLHCFSKLKLINKKIIKSKYFNDKKYNIKYYLLFEYNQYAKDYMHFYKRKNDIVLCLLFKDLLTTFFNENFDLQNSSITYIPSSKQTYNIRKFNPNYELLAPIDNLTLCEGPKRLDNIKQGKLSFKNRKASIHKYKSTSIPLNKNLIIFDDVISTGTTIDNYINNIENISYFNNIFVICLFSSKNFK